MTPTQFVAKWSVVTLRERASSQEHFIDLCGMLGQPTPAAHDATGAEYTFEKGVKVTGPASRGAKGIYGSADVWWRGKFGWEYKTKDKYRDLNDAYRQLCQYREGLENPPLLIVSDITRTEIHTNFTGTAKQVHVIELGGFDRPENLAALRRVFTDPESFRPTVTPEAITEEVAERIAGIARSLGRRGNDPHEAAHFLMKCTFCLFAQDIELLPGDVFTRILERWRTQPESLTSVLTELFAKMRTGGAFGAEEIACFNGGLFDDSRALELTRQETEDLLRAARQDWSAVEPAIFGTLFERSLDPSKRAQIGAHYTGREEIMLIVEPVVMTPLRREWEAVQQKVHQQLERRSRAQTDATKRKANTAMQRLLVNFLHRLSMVRILDPACGSGNFLYVAIQQLLYLEKEVIRYAARPEIGLGLFPTVRPTRLHGIEVNPYAAELAHVVIWIGYLQWMHDNGFNVPREPILEPFQTIENRDAILDLSDPEHPEVAPWPEADFIIGNPPFLGSKLFRQHGLSEEYISAMYAVFDIPNASDLCCYWFERAREEIARRPEVRAGLLATQGIRGGVNRTVLERIKETGDIFMAWSDRDWILDGASVHVSVVGFDGGCDREKWLDGRRVEAVNADLRCSTDTTAAVRLPGNRGVYQRPPEKGGRFELSYEQARRLIGRPNPNGRPNSDVMRPWINAVSLLRERNPLWIIDFEGVATEGEASGFEAPFSHVFDAVRKSRTGNTNPRFRKLWWRYRRRGEGVREAAGRMSRLLGTAMVAKHRIFTWLDAAVQPDKTIMVFARSDDYFFGVLHSSVHELWARRMGTQLREAASGFRYTPTTCFETFPLPWPPGEEPTDDGKHRRIAEAARELNVMRERWLNPPEWIEPIARTMDAEDDFSDVPEEARTLIRHAAVMARAAGDPRLGRRTLTRLYNERPTWLKLAHRRLDEAVLAAYAEVDPEGGWTEAWAAVWEESGAGPSLPEGHPLAAARAEVDRKVLANLLRLNLARA